MGNAVQIICGVSTCRKRFCTSCICKHFGPVETRRIHLLGKCWQCFVCDVSPLIELNTKIWCMPLHGGGKKIATKNFLESRIVISDISNGREKCPIPVINDVDDSTPFPFTYVPNPVGVSALKRKVDFVSCCSCTDNCADKSKCECAQGHGGCFAYNQDGVIENEKASGIYECNFKCSCNVNICQNRVVGKGPHLPLEVFRCKEAGKGWGVRCKIDISPGTFICDYTGEVISESAADKRGTSYGDEYLFTLDAFGRSRGCQRLEDLGLKSHQLEERRSLFMPMREERNSKRSAEEANAFGVPVFDVFSKRKDLENVLGGSLVARILKSSSVATFTEQGEEHVKLVGTAPLQKQSLKNYSTSKEENVIKRKLQHAASGKRKKPFPNVSSKSASASAPSDESTRAYSRVVDEENMKERARWLSQKEARSIITDRVCLETESLDSTFAIDAKWYGNIGRFLNHSCDPNVEKINVFVDSHDIRLPRVAFFTNCYIPKGTELCYDYGYFQGNVAGKHQKCLCGATNCRDYMY